MNKEEINSKDGPLRRLSCVDVDAAVPFNFSFHNPAKLIRFGEQVCNSGAF